MPGRTDNGEDYHRVKVELVDEGEDLSDLRRANDFFEKIRQQITQWAEKKGGTKGKKVAEMLLVAPDIFMLLVRLARDKRIPVSVKATVLAGIVYFLAPIDFLPEAIFGPLGYGDDLLLAVHIINLILNANREVVLENWSGNSDLLLFLQDVAANAEKLVNKNVYRKLMDFFNNKRRK